MVGKNALLPTLHGYEMYTYVALQDFFADKAAGAKASGLPVQKMKTPEEQVWPLVMLDVCMHLLNVQLCISPDWW